MNVLDRRPAVATLALATLLTLNGCVPTAPERPTELFALEEATIADINAPFDAGALTCQGLVQLYLNRAAAYDDDGPRIDSIITVNPRALDTAQALDEDRASTGPRSALHCIPVLLKDNIDTDDMPTSNGSAILKDAIPPDDTYITKALRDAAALVLGKASMGEFAGGSYNSVDGQTINPYNLLRATWFGFGSPLCLARQCEQQHRKCETYRGLHVASATSARGDEFDE